MELAAGEYRLLLAPERGGSILAFDWQGEALFRPVCGPSILDVACFPLVPFSNRIAFGRFRANGQDVQLAPNFPGSDHPHTLHGFGWLSPWTIQSYDANVAIVEHLRSAEDWPWSYHAEQKFELAEDGLTVTLSVTNLSDGLMPAGLGLHPYLPSADAVYHGLHRGEWQNDDDCLPRMHDVRDCAVDWWQGGDISTREVDTVYTDREGPLSILWPSRNLSLQISPVEALPHTVIYTPGDQNFFCVEPVSHPTNALNSVPSSMKWLAPGQSFAVAISFNAARTDSFNERPAPSP